MSVYDKTPIKTIKKKKKLENFMAVDSAILEKLSDTHILILAKPSNRFPKAKFVCKICPYHMDDVDRALKHSLDIMHSRNLNKLCTKNLLTYLPKPTKVQIEAINECLEQTLSEDHFINNNEYQRRVDICMKMNELTVECNSSNRLAICGSLLSGLSLINVSDVNIYLDMQQTNIKNTGYLSELEKFSKLFKSKLNLKTEIKLEKNNCGLFCKDKQNVIYHISASNQGQKLTSEIVRLYLKLDIRAEKLAKLFRFFAYKAFIDQVKDGLFHSQVFPLLVIFYLQQLSIPILPNLHKLAEINASLLPEASLTRVFINDMEFKYLSDNIWIRKFWTPPINEMSLAELWVGLLKFYVVDFNCMSYIVSIRCLEPVLKSDRNMVNKRLAVEDPFDVKRNLLFSWTSTDVIDFVNDQLQGCYTYFAVPQIRTEEGSVKPLFKKVNFHETTMENMKPNLNVTPIFSKDDFGETLEVLEIKFRKLHTEQKAFYDVTKWPVELIVKSGLEVLLTSIFNSTADIKHLVGLLELKVKHCQRFTIDNYGKFKDYMFRLAKNVIQEFSNNLEQNNTWSQTEFNTKSAFEIIKRSSQKFINESLNISGNEEEDDEDDELPDSDANELDETVTEITIDEVVEIDSIDINNDDNANTVKVENIQTTIRDTDTWKLPIEFKQIYATVKGVALSSENPDEYNEHRFNSLEKKQLCYDFNKITIHPKKLTITCSLCNTKGHRKENCVFAIPRYDDMQDVLKNIDHAWLIKLKTILLDKYKNITPSGDRTKQNEKIFEKITEIIKNKYPTARPQLFGSTINGFITKASDLDICLEFYDDQSRLLLSNKELTSRLKIIGQEVKRMQNMMRVDYILRAKVPIVKFYMKNNVQGDISINNSLGLQNTKMLKLYAEISSGVKLLGNLIKFVAKTCEIGDASQGTLSSYAYMLMLIHFLQKRKVLPVLQELYEGERPTMMIDGWDAWYQSDMATIYKLWEKQSCNTNIEYLWLDFFYYYTVEFDIDKEVVSIRQSTPLYKIDKNWQSAYMAVEDPFNLSHNLCGCLCLENCRYILECFAHVLKLHCNSDNLSRPDGVHYMLLEPQSLKPSIVNSRSCFNCNKPGHVARDCVEKSVKRTPTKPNVVNQPSALPALPASLLFKPSNVGSRFYLQSDFADATESENVVPFNIPLKSFKGDISQYSVVPLSMKFNDQTVIVPMLVSKNEIIEKKLNILLKNGLNNNVCEFPIDSLKPVNEPTNRQYDELQNNSPLNNGAALRRPISKMSPMSIQQNRMMMAQTAAQQYNRNAMLQHLPQYELPIRMLSNNQPNNGQRYQYANYTAAPPGYQVYSHPADHMRQYQNYNHSDIEAINRRAMHQPAANHTPRSNRK